MTLPSYPGLAHSSLAVSETIVKLATALRELHKVSRLSCDYSPDDSAPEAADAFWRVNEMGPLYADLAVVYLRRAPDLLVKACNPLLFEHWHTIPSKFKDCVEVVHQFETYKPLCDFAVLREAIDQHSEWFDSLRGMSPITRKKGIRDALEHRPVRFMVSKNQAGSNRPYIEIVLQSTASDVATDEDILCRVRESVAGLCHLMTAIHSTIGVGDPYQWGSQLFLAGDDRDVVGYWPEIVA